MKKLSIGYFADGVWGHNAFRKIANSSDFEIKFICPRFDTKDETLKEFSDKYNISYIKTNNVNSKEFLNKIREVGCDIFVSMSFNQIFKKEILGIPRYGIINCHAGKLPFYRGRNILNWALINDEKEFGITVHYVDEGIDTGDIILQRTYPITDSDDYNSLLGVAHVECAELLFEALLQINNGSSKRIKQDTIHSVGMYCGMRGLGDEILDWNQTSREVFNFIRAVCKPCPMATCYLNGIPFYINHSKLIGGAPIYRGIPGQILNKSADGLIVKTKDSVILVDEYYYDGKIMVGDRLKNSIKYRTEIYTGGV